MRHMAELVPLLSEEDRESRHIMIIGTDGGSDHNVTHVRVQLSLIQFALEHDFDVLVAIRTAPNSSVTNPAERCMSTVNIALNGLALSCNVLEPEEMAKIRNLNLKKQWRDAASNDSTIPELAWRGTADALLETRFSSLQYKGKPFTVSKPADIMDQKWTQLPFRKFFLYSVQGRPVSRSQLRGVRERSSCLSAILLPIQEMSPYCRYDNYLTI
jgi:hypothetical protein